MDAPILLSVGAKISAEMEAEILVRRRAGEPMSSIATSLGTSKATIGHICIRSGQTMGTATPEAVMTIKKNYTEKSDQLFNRLSSKITDEKLEAMAGRDMIVGIGILYDKLASLHGFASQIVDHRVALVGRIEHLDRGD